MKKLIFKILVAVLLLGTVAIPITTTEAAVPRNMIFKTPTQARDIGYTIKTSTTATRAELNKLSDILDYDNTVKSIHLGIIASLVTVPLSPKLSITVGTGASVISAFASSKKSKIVTKALKKSSKKKFKVNITYSYRQTGSGDGYYYMQKISIK